MSKTTARWINFDTQSLSGTSTLTVKLVTDGGIEKTVDGLQIKTSGVTNDMLEGSIALSKLAEAVIKADGSVTYTGDQDMGGNNLTNMAQASNPADAVTLSQLQSWSSSLDFQADVFDIQEDASLDPGTPN